MLERRLILFFAAFMVSSSLSTSLLPYTRFQSTWFHVLLIVIPTLALFVALLVWLYKKFPNTLLGQPLKSFSLELFGITLILLATAFLDKMSTKAHFCLDNGTERSLNLITNASETYTVAAKRAVEIDLPIGNNTLNIDGRDTVVNFDEREGTYIYNPENANQYVIGSVTYQPWNSKQGSENPDSAQMKFVTGIFFHNQTDYLFSPPELTIEKKSEGENIKKRYSIVCGTCWIRKFQMNSTKRSNV